MKFTKIIDKKHKYYNGIVYDLTIEGSHSYNIEDLIVHNSGAGSLVCYSTDITKVDPIEYDLLFERFLNPDRGKLPDVDADFCIKNGYKVFDYLNKKYGKDHCCNVIVFQRLQYKAVIKDLARCLGVDFKEVNEFTSSIPKSINNDGKPTHIKDLIKHPQFRWFFDKYPLIRKHALKLEGLPKSSSQHPAGICVSPVEITNLTPVLKAKEDFGSDESYLSMFEKEQVEQSGLVKYDVLRLSNVSDIQTMIEMVEDNYKLHLEKDKIPLDDKKTWDLISEGKTLGVFQFASPLGISVLRKIKPQNLEELSAANAFIRPGASGLEEYLMAKNDSSKIRKIHPKIDKYLIKTAGAIVYQEQIMQLISELMGVSFGQADIYRRALEKPNKGKNVKIVKEFNDTVIDKASKLGFTEKTADFVRKLIIDNCGYGFNKCLSARETIYGNNDLLTIEEMYKIKNDINYAKAQNKLSLYEQYQQSYGTALSMNEEKKLIKNDIIDITFSGVKKVYLVETETGKKVKCTMNHKFPTPNGNKLLEELTIGDELYVNDNSIVTSRIIKIKFLCEENTYNIEMADPYHNLLMNDGIIVCNSHSICYSLISYWTAWFKVNYPIIFFTVMLNSCNEEDFSLFMQEAKQSGITINPPSVNKSKYLCTIEDLNDLVIRIGLKSIKGVGPAAVKCIEEKQPFNSLDDFFEQKASSVNKGVLKALVSINAFNDLGIKIEQEDIEQNLPIVKNNLLFLNREQMKLFLDKYFEINETKAIPNFAIPIDNIKGKYLNSIEFVIEDNTIIFPENRLNEFDIELSEEDKNLYKTRKRPKGILKTETNKKNKNLSIFRQIIKLNINDLLNVKDNSMENYINEMTILGYSFIKHPCSKFINKIYDTNDPKSTFNDMKDGSLFMTCGIINGLEEKLTKNNKKYYLINLVTPVDIVQLQLWNNQFEKYRLCIKNNGIIKATGIKNYGKIQIQNMKLMK